jgi:outer membrane protein TolC
VNAGKETLNTAKRGLEIAEERYKAGLMTNVEVMDAQLAFKSARMNYIKSLYDYIVARISLYRALGMTENLVKGGKI